jgi:hypothetical protein
MKAPQRVMSCSHATEELQKKEKRAQYLYNHHLFFPSNGYRKRKPLDYTVEAKPHIQSRTTVSHSTWCDLVYLSLNTQLRKFQVCRNKGSATFITSEKKKK